MALNEVRKVLESATWSRETPLVALLNEIVERHDEPITDREGKQWPSKITRTFGAATSPAGAWCNC